MSWIWELCGLVGGLVGLVVIAVVMLGMVGFSLYLLKQWLYRKGWIS